MRRRTFLETVYAFMASLPVTRRLSGEPIPAALTAAESADPPAHYRPAPFWIWNDLLDPNELRWQIQEFKAKGYGGVFNHSRVGLATPYLSEEWMRCVAVSLDECNKRGLSFWIYDEDGWPIGFAGGLVMDGHPELVGQTLTKEDRKRFDGDWFSDIDTVAVFAGRMSGAREIESFREILSADQPPTEDEVAMRFVVRRYPKTNWFNGSAYPDLLNPEAVQRFLDITLGRYSQHFQPEFGGLVPGIFTDEPSCHNFFSADPQLPWTGGMLNFFRERRGYDLREKLPLLVYRGAGFEKLRYDFWRTAAERFVESYSQPYGERCAKLGLRFTGHYYGEDTPSLQTVGAGDVMLHYWHQQLPCIDHLGRNIRDPLTLKQVSSVAHQKGQPRVGVEIYGTSGHPISFSDLKWIADFHFALGVNSFVPHLSWYSMTRERKRDIPATFSYHEPFWSEIKLLNDYSGRAAYFTRQGEPGVRVLLLHNLGSVWSYYTTFAPPLEIHGSGGDFTVGIPEVQRYDAGLLNTVDWLLAQQRDFDLGDEILLERHGSVEGKHLRMGKMVYDLVLNTAS